MAMQVLKLSVRALVAMTLCGLLSVGNCAPSWQQEYEGDDAKGENVIALWKFSPGSPEADSSRQGNSLTIRGQDTSFVSIGKFNGAIQIMETNEPGDTRQGVSTPNTPSLNPAGAFSIEMWLQPSEELQGKKAIYLLDKKFLPRTSDKNGGNQGYMLRLRKAGAGRFHFLIDADLGFGTKSEVITSDPYQFSPGVWQHLAFTYDGKGEGKIFINGRPVGTRSFIEAGSVAAGKWPLVIGDRIGSIGGRFPGLISEVRISSGIVIKTIEEVVLSTDESRTAFHRMEKDAHLQVGVGNQTRDTLTGVKVHLTGLQPEAIVAADLPELKPGETTTIRIPLDTTLKAGSYAGVLTLHKPDGTIVEGRLAQEITLMPRPLPQQMPVVMWGQTAHLQLLKEIGFTHYFGLWQSSTSPAVEFVPKDRVASARRRIDKAFAMNLGVLANISPKSPAFRKKFGRLGREGQIIGNINGLYPEAQQAFSNVGRFVAETFGDLPGFQGAMVNTETRDLTKPSYHPFDREAYRKASGKDIPVLVGDNARRIAENARPRLPPTGIISEDNELLDYYRWFWKYGDGWSHLNTLVDEGLKSTSRKDLWTWHDPAVRVPSIYGSGGNVNFISQWTYAYPDPLKISLAGDELAAMAEGNPGQQTMNMTQIIWYRAQTAPAPKGAPSVQQAGWEKELPDAKFITIPPDILSEALWLKLSHPVKGIMYHGWGSLVGLEHKGYLLTNTETRERLTSLLREVVKPLGPVLMQLPDATTDVAFLESFTSQIFAGRGTFGWGRGWGADSYIIARHAGLQPKIIYEEELLGKGLGNYKVLFLTHCDVITEKVAAEILKFQKRGGIIIGDEFLAAGIQPDILLTSNQRVGQAKEDKNALLAKARALRAELDAFYQRPVESDNAEVIVRRRTAGKGEYIFTINDQRTYGDYVGQHRKVMEKGVPAQAQITLARSEGKVYDLTKQREVPTTKRNDALQFPVDLEAGGGSLFLVLDHPVGSLQIEAPDQITPKKPTPIRAKLRDASENSISAVIPMHIAIRDPQGVESEGSGYYGAVDGSVNLLIDLASNDLSGIWKIEVTEGLTGQKKSHSFQVIHD